MASQNGTHEDETAPPAGTTSDIITARISQSDEVDDGESSKVNELAFW
jgi:hypothetical protein